MMLAASITAFSRVLVLIGIPVDGTVAGAILVGPPGLVIAASLYLAFCPPEAYLRRVRARAEAIPT
jgi:hypothetical protein